MAYSDSGELPVSQMYGLGEYIFELKVQTVHEPGEEDVVSVYAICRNFDGTRETQAVDFPDGTTIENWSVEANETEASVYVTTKEESVDPVPCAPSGGVKFGGPNDYYQSVDFISGSGQLTFAVSKSGNVESYTLLAASDEPNAIVQYSVDHTNVNLSSSYKLNGKTVYYGTLSASTSAGIETITPVADNIDPHGKTAWGMIYGAHSGGEDSVLVARFAIDIREAATEDWDEPGDDGPPGTTLYVTVTGATAGSCTGTPADNETVKGYGDGGDGGYGGGGGAGASTVIIYEFATSIADSVVQEAISRGPGTGGHGGKGGKGGDGCILIFY